MDKRIVLGIGLGMLFCSASALAAGNDESWEMSMKMDMPGMPMPARTQLSCLPKDGAYRPDDGPKGENCQTTEYRVSGNTVRWKMQCSGAQAMTGIGEVTRTADTMNGTIKMTMNDQGRAMQMTQIISGRRVGTCDAVAERKKLDDTVTSIRDDMCSKQVEMAVTTGGYEPGVPEAFSRNDQCLGSKPVVCERARTLTAKYDGYLAYTRSRGWVVAECRIDLEARRVALCKTAVTEGKNSFIKENCPAEVAAYKAEYERNCQGFGRGFTVDAGHPNAKLCRSLMAWTIGSAPPDQTGAADESAGGSSGQAAQVPAIRPTAAKEAEKKAPDPASAIMEGLGKLKGLFGR